MKCEKLIFVGSGKVCIYFSKLFLHTKSKKKIQTYLRFFVSNPRRTDFLSFFPDALNPFTPLPCEILYLPFLPQSSILFMKLLPSRCPVSNLPFSSLVFQPSLFHLPIYSPLLSTFPFLLFSSLKFSLFFLFR